VVHLAKALVLLSVLAFGITGLGYFVVPAAMLSIVGISPAATTDFLIRTEGVALLAGGGMLWAVRDGPPSQLKLVLAALAVYHIVGSLVDLDAFGQGVVGSASIPSAGIRIVIGGLCVVAAAGLTNSASNR
jgi:hypothetical protein